MNKLLKEIGIAIIIIFALFIMEMMLVAIEAL